MGTQLSIFAACLALLSIQAHADDLLFDDACSNGLTSPTAIELMPLMAPCARRPHVR